jgi:nitrite reductase (NADH) small subunit
MESEDRQDEIAGLVRICGAAELPRAGGLKCVTVRGREVCLANVDGHIAALSNVCPHRGGPLCEGSIEDGRVVCPWHGWAFDSRSGEASHSAQAKVEVFPLVVRAESVFLDWRPH